MFFFCNLIYCSSKINIVKLILLCICVIMLSMRLDLLLVQRGLYPTRARAVAAIDSGLVTVNGKPAKKPSQAVEESDELVGGELPYSVGRGSLKLAHALEYFKVNPNGLFCLDVGASTGGFTDVLLKNGAKRVYAVDVGTNQLADDLRNNPCVISMEQTDIRDVVPVETVDLIVIDVSFISLTNIVDVLPRWMPKTVIALIKPQFEVAREVAAKHNGIIKSPQLHQESVARVVLAFENCGFQLRGVTQSPIQGGSGNVEFLACFEIK